MFNPIDERKSLKFRRNNLLSDDLIKRLELYGTLEGHEGCVNCIEWNYPGTLLCSVSDDCNIILWDPFKKKKITQFHSNHTGNIFAAKFMEFNNDSLLVTAAADNRLILHDLITHNHLMICECHRQRVKKLATSSYDSHLFFSAGEDALVLQTDIRTKHQCNQDKISNVLIDLKTHCSNYAKVTSIACNPVRSELIAIGSNDQFVRLYDRRMIRLIQYSNAPIDNLPEDCVKYYTIGNPSNKRKYDHALACTNLSFSQTGDELLANISSDHVYLFDILNSKKPKIFSSDLTNIFGQLADDGDNKEFNIIDDFPSDSEPIKRLKTSNSSTSASLDSQMPSTSKQDDVQFEGEDEIEQSIEEISKQLIERINREHNPNLVEYKAKTKLPKHISPLYKSAISAMKKEKFSEAIELINEAISKMPNVSRFYCLRANAFSKRKYNNDQYCALKDYFKSLEIDPNNKESHLKLAQVLYDLDYFENANQCLNYFRENQSRDTRYKHYKELEKLISIALKDGKKRVNRCSKKRMSEVKKKKELKYKKFVENLKLSYFSLTHNHSSNSNDQSSSRPSTIDLTSSSSSSSDLLSSSMSDSSDNDWRLDKDSANEEEDDERSNSANNDHLYEIHNRVNEHIHDSDSDVPNYKRTKSRKEMQWRTQSYDFEKRFYGHCNVSTDIMEANFFGSNGDYIIGGSDDGNFYCWNKKTTNIVNIIKADECIVNCVQPHYNSCFLATSGIDNNIKLWSPTMSEDKLKEHEKTLKFLIRQREKENQKKMSSSGFGIMFLRVTHLGDNSSDTEDEHSNIREARLNLNLRECLPS